MSHKFRFTKDCMERLKNFASGEAAPAPDAKDVKRDEKENGAVKEPEQKEKTAVKKEKNKLQKPDEKPLMPERQEVKANAALTVATRSDIGRVRKSNQDAVIADDAERLYGVADGMGGHNGGETASAGARDGLTELLRGKAPEMNSLRTGIMAVNRRLFLEQKEDESLSGMGTTLTALWVGERVIYVGHVGDSRAYRLRDGRLEQMTMDHSMVAELVRAGMLTPEEAANHPMRNVITRAVGTEEGIDVDLMAEERRPGDVWLVCSDGLHGMVTDQAMTEILLNNTLEEAADRLIEAALAAGGRDNVSLVLLRDGEGQA